MDKELFRLILEMSHSFPEAVHRLTMYSDGGMCMYKVQFEVTFKDTEAFKHGLLKKMDDEPVTAEANPVILLPAGNIIDCDTCDDEKILQCQCNGFGHICGDCQGEGEFDCPDCGEIK
jgi:hypothetical protein